MKVLCKRKAFSGGRIINPGEIIPNVTECPSWGKKVDDNGTVIKSDETSVDKVRTEDTEQVPDTDNTNDVIENQKEDANTTPEELEQKLDELLTKGLDLGIMIDGLEKLTINEQIEKLETEIKKKSEEV
jgi:hypothetical protein